jgi:hypothetical protein
MGKLNPVDDSVTNLLSYGNLVLTDAVRHARGGPWS